jgi:hypothetical protein
LSDAIDSSGLDGESVTMKTVFVLPPIESCAAHDAGLLSVAHPKRRNALHTALEPQ